MRIRRRNWIIKRIALGFAVAALVAPAAAQARVDEGLNGQSKASSGYIPFVTDFPSSAPQHSYVLRRDGNALGTQPGLRSTDLIENVRLAPRGSAEVVASSGFDWSDAGIAAGIVVGILGLGTIAVRATRQVGKPQTA
ncbi:MAG TPA: hypothetical protein VE693_10985 [Gaiellaceae bacterium]|jgi:hypothetical protein|nr:hypothetical protein [Gaiellaceae bacterium]